MPATPVADLEADMIDAIMVGSVPCLWGPPGTGKTALSVGIGAKLKLPTFTLIGSLCDPTDVNGFPVVDESSTADSSGRRHKVIKFAPRDFLRRIADEHGGRALIFLDEFTGNGPAVMAAMLRSIMDKCFGDFQLDPHKVAMICAANPPDQAANGQELPLPMVNRLLHFQFPTGDSAALEWASNYPSYWGREPEIRFGDEAVPADAARRARACVAGFVAKFPSAWHRIPKEVSSTSGYPTARSWDRVGRHLGRCLHRGRSPLSIARLVGGEVGPDAATEFQAYLRESDIPDPEAIIRDPDAYKPSGRLDVDFVVLTGVAAAVAADVTPARLRAAFKVCNRVATARGAGGAPTYEAAVVACSKLAKHCKGPALEALAAKHKMSAKDRADLVRDIYELSKPYHNLTKNVFETPLS